MRTLEIAQRENTICCKNHPKIKKNNPNPELIVGSPPRKPSVLSLPPLAFRNFLVNFRLENEETTSSVDSIRPHQSK